MKKLKYEKKGAVISQTVINVLIIVAFLIMVLVLVTWFTKMKGIFT